MYTAFICKVATRAVPELDNLVIGDLGGYQVLVSKDIQDGSVGVFFDQGGVLSAEFCKVHDLVRRRLEDGSSAGGFLEENRRVRAIKFKGIKSDGLFMPLKALEYTGHDLSKLKLGDQFEGLNGHEICQKYLTPATIRSKNAQANNVKLHKELSTFPRHKETEQFMKNVSLIPKGAIIHISSKAHGCVFKDTLIDTLEYGSKTIEEIVNNKLNCHIKAFDIRTNDIVYAKVDNHYFKANHGEWYEVELETGEKVIITGNNPMWLPKFNCYRKVELLKEGDTVLIS